MKKAICILFVFLFAVVTSLGALASSYGIAPINVEEKPIDISADGDAFEVRALSAVLMDAETGTVLFKQNADEPLPPASVTKIMTLLLVAEALDAGNINLTDVVTVSETAASMGGSQVYLKVGEQMSVEDLIKSVVIASANDAALALAEFVAGSEEAFVSKMNSRAAELGMKNTNFENTNGLDDSVTNHKISAMDIAIMSRELVRHDEIMKYCSIWMDTIRDGAFGLTNTNRLIRFYPGATGLKTGSTSTAKFCMSATAKRDGMHLIAVIMGAESRDIRNEEAKKLLDYGFSNYALYRFNGEENTRVKIVGGVSDSCAVDYSEYSCIVKKSDLSKISFSVSLPESVAAPTRKGDKIGEVTFKCGEERIGIADILAGEQIDKISFRELWLRMMRLFFVKI